MSVEYSRKSDSGSENRKKTYLITSRYSPEELAELDEAASRAGLTRSGYQRVQSLAQPKTRATRRAPVERELLAKTLGQLGKIGSDLNQISRAIDRDSANRPAIAAALAELRALVPDIFVALGRKP